MPQDLINVNATTHILEKTVPFVIIIFVNNIY
jgi:hypothetical protein